MGPWRWHVVAVLGLLAAAGTVAQRTWSGASAGQFDPVAAVIALVSLAVSIAALRLGVLAQRQADTDVVAAAKRLAVAVADAETEARRQLLGGRGRTIHVEFTFRPATAHNAAGALTKGSLEKVVDYYRRLKPRRMVITGVGGSGKTVLALELILGLLRDRADDAPVPVRLSAALLDTSGPPESAVQDWLVEHLTQNYRLPKTAAQQMVAARMVLPVLDRLDEMDAIEQSGYVSRTGQAIRACNAYLDGTQMAAMVLTCRIDQYEALQQAHEWVHDAARVQLRPVGLPAARSFLAQQAIDKDRWQPVLEAMQQSGHRPLARALSTPWRLTLAAIVYDLRDPTTGSYLRDPADLTGPGLHTEDKIRDHLLGLFIPAAIAVHGGRYPACHVHRWLGVLAGYLDTNTPTATRPTHVIAGRALSGTDLVLHELWPLAGTRRPRALATGIIAAILLVGAAAMLSRSPVPIGFSRWQTAGVGTFAIGVLTAMGMAWGSTWPTPRRLNLSAVWTGVGWRQLMFGLVLGLGGGLALGLALGLTSGRGGVLGGGFGGALVFGVTGGFTGVLAFGLTSQDRELKAADPRSLVWADLTLGLAFGLGGGLAFGLAVVFAGALTVGLTGALAFGLTDALAFGLTGGLAFGLAFGLVGLRFVALLLCTRRWSRSWLPWRLGRFLYWCYGAGLVRVAGIGYQFRHRELQDYLARNPTP
jgi:NACHT domain